MRYIFTDFFAWQQPLIYELRKRGYGVYGVRSGEGDYESIEESVIVNRIGFLVTDSPIKTPIQSRELSKIGNEDFLLSDEIESISGKIKGKIEKAKELWDSEEEKRQENLKKAFESQDNYRERDRYYNLSLRKDNPFILSDGSAIRFQTIFNNGDGTQEVMYFIRNPKGKIVVDSTKVSFNLNARYKRMAKVIAKSNGHCA